MLNFQRMAGWDEMREFVRGLGNEKREPFLVDGARYGSRTRLTGLGSPCTTDVLISQTKKLLEGDASTACERKESHERDSNPRPTHYECVALPN